MTFRIIKYSSGYPKEMELDWTKIKCSMKEVHENVLFPWSKQTLMMQPLYYLYYIHLFVVFFSHLIDFLSPIYKCRLSRFILAERCKWISINNVNKHMKYQVCNKTKKSHQFNVESGCLMGKKPCCQNVAQRMWQICLVY